MKPEAQMVEEKPVEVVAEVTTVQKEGKLQLDSADAQAAAESAIDKEWREIKLQNEQDRQQMNESAAPIQSFNHPLKFNEDGSLSFYWFDAHEENYGADIFIFGKVWQPEVNSFVSCALRV